MSETAGEPLLGRAAQIDQRVVDVPRVEVGTPRDDRPCALPDALVGFEPRPLLVRQRFGTHAESIAHGDAPRQIVRQDATRILKAE